MTTTRKKNPPVTIDTLTDKIKRHILANIAAVKHMKVGRYEQSFTFSGFSLVYRKTHPGKGGDFYYTLNGRHIAWDVGSELWSFIEKELEVFARSAEGTRASVAPTLEWLQEVVEKWGL